MSCDTLQRFLSLSLNSTQLIIQFILYFFLPLVNVKELRIISKRPAVRQQLHIMWNMITAVLCIIHQQHSPKMDKPQ